MNLQAETRVLPPSDEDLELQYLQARYEALGYEPVVAFLRAYEITQASEEELNL